MRTILVTGAAGGIGSCIANVFRKRRWRVIGLDLSVVSQADISMQVDVSQESGWADVVDELRALDVRLDAIVNSAGVLLRKPCLELSRADWETSIGVNLLGPFFAVKYLFSQLARPAAILNIGSVHSRATAEHFAVYSASKAALASLSRSLAIELAGERVTVNTLLPGAVDTPMLRLGCPAGSPATVLADLARRQVVGEVGSPETIAHFVFYLVKVQLRQPVLTGQEFVIDGGALARLSTY